MRNVFPQSLGTRTAKLLPLLLISALASRASISLSYRDLITAKVAPTLTVIVESSNSVPGVVTLKGGDARRPSAPFHFDWGDGKSSRSFFPASHSYADRGRNYVIRVTASYNDGSSGSTDALVRFAGIKLGDFAIPPEIAVTVPDSMPPIASTQAGYHVPPVEVFPGDALSTYSRAVFERVMSAYAMIQQDLVNNDLQRDSGAFRQIVMAAPQSQKTYAFSVWYSQPVMFVAQARALGADPDWSSIAHEMGHNATLNSPAAYRMGGKIDGSANAIVSEALAQIFQHVTCHLLVNHAASYGLPDDLALEIARRARGSFAYLKSRNASAPFASWNDPATPGDETLPTFMTIAYQFFAAGDFDGEHYRIATKRLMYFLQHFDASWQERFSPKANSPAAESFRATMMVGAVSYGVEQDLRARFRALGFPVDDAIFAELTGKVGRYSGQH